MLHDEHDTQVYDHRAKERLLHSFYTDLLGAPQPTSRSFDLHAFLPPVAGLHELHAPFTRDENRDALWSMCSASSPGPDSFGHAFYKTFWTLV